MDKRGPSLAAGFRSAGRWHSRTKALDQKCSHEEPKFSIPVERWQGVPTTPCKICQYQTLIHTWNVLPVSHLSIRLVALEGFNFPVVVVPIASLRSSPLPPNLPLSLRAPVRA